MEGRKENSGVEYGCRKVPPEGDHGREGKFRTRQGGKLVREKVQMNPGPLRGEVWLKRPRSDQGKGERNAHVEDALQSGGDPSVTQKRGMTVLGGGKKLDCAIPTNEEKRSESPRKRVQQWGTELMGEKNIVASGGGRH